MDIEQFAALAKPPDHVKDFACRILQHLADGTLAEIEPVIRAFVHRYKALEPVDRAEHARDTAITGGRVGILRVARQPHLGRGRHWHHGGEKMIDALPIFVFGDRARRGRRCRLIGAAPAKGGVARSAAAGLARRARDADDRQIVFGGGNAGFGEPLDQTANAVELALPLGLLG
jgi:hypothetical protein